jgi:hypothetical protein
LALEWVLLHPQCITLGLVLQSCIRRKVKTTVPFLKARHLLKQSHKRRLWPDTDDPILNHIDEHLLEQQALHLLSLPWNLL